MVRGQGQKRINDCVLDLFQLNGNVSLPRYKFNLLDIAYSSFFHIQHLLAHLGREWIPMARTVDLSQDGGKGVQGHLRHVWRRKRY